MVIMLPDIYPKELKTYVHTKTCTQVFIAALFIIVKTWKQPRCPSVGGRINRVWYLQTCLLLSTKEKELRMHEKTWQKLKCILLSEGN